MNSPGVNWADRRIRIPELRLEHLPSGIVEAASVLAMVLGVAAQLRLEALK
jgi:hypothetical protein